jgi:trans-feruloyl-CoA hydratase/vanillin synthase
MGYQTLLIEVDEGIGWLTFNRPNKKNAMNPQLHLDMAAALEELRYNPDVRVVVVSGAGNSFCSGMDLKEFFTDLKDQPVEYDRILRVATEWRGRTLRYFPKPTIAMVNGYCFGGAFSIEGCDLAIAADEATFGLSEINFKHFPGGAVSKAIANLLRPRDALWYGMLGRPFDGKVAEKIGLVNLSVPLEKLREETRVVARELAAKDPWALKATKDAYRHSLDMPWDAAMNYSSAKEMELALRQKDAWRLEGIGDFLAGKYRPGLPGTEKEPGKEPGQDPDKG